MRVLVVSPFFSPGHGGSSNLLGDVAHGLQANGHDVSILTHAWDKADPSVYQSLPFPIHHVGGGHFRGTSSAAMLYEMVTQTALGRYDMILSGVAYPCAILAYLTCLITHIRYAVYAYSEDVTVVGSSGWRRMALARALRRASAVITISHFTANKIASLGVALNRIVLIPPWIDPVPYREVPPALCASLRQKLRLRHAPTILTVARLEARKGHDTIISALPLVLRHVQDLQYVIVGRGDPEPLLWQARSLGVQQQLIIVESLPDSELQALYQLCDLYAMVSRWDREQQLVEGFGIVYLEAAASGRPCIAGSHGGVPDAVDDQVTGLVVEPTSVEDVAEALLQLLQDPARATAMGKAGRQRVEAGFQRQRLLPRVISLLEKVGRQRSPW